MLALSGPFPFAAPQTTHSLLPPITVVVSTKDRGYKIVEAVETILLNDYPSFEVRVIDQSDDIQAQTFLQPFSSDPRFYYEKTDTEGLATGRNLAIRAATSELIAATDDDCRTPPNWLQEMASAFAVNPRIGVIFGNTNSSAHNASDGFVPSYVRKAPFLARSIHEKHRVEGMGACMGLKKSLWQILGGFDELLGPGALFKAADDVDFAVRTLLAGYYIYETPALGVAHLGFRSWDQGRRLIHNYLYGLGGMFAKHLKCRNWQVLFFLAHLAWRWAFDHPAINYGHIPPRGFRLQAFTRGFLKGIAYPVDRMAGRYVCR